MVDFGLLEKVVVCVVNMFTNPMYTFLDIRYSFVCRPTMAPYNQWGARYSHWVTRYRH